MNWWTRKYDPVFCPVCKKEFKPTYGVAQEYCTKACKQKAYRERKKALRSKLAISERNTN